MRLRTASFMLFLALALTPAAFAADPRLPASVKAADLPAAYHTDANLYLTAREAADAVSRLDRVVLIDVRTHEETLFNGVASLMHRHIPYVSLHVDHEFDAARGRYRLDTNPDFVKAVENLLAEMRLDRTATIITYCSVGERSARAANLLGRSGFTNVYSIVDGFDGDPTAKPGPGWKASGLPWTHEMKPSQAYKSPSF
jgi:rhodanese-related sulfurtransferase